MPLVIDYDQIPIMFSTKGNKMAQRAYSMEWDTDEKLGICVYVEGKLEWDDSRAVQEELNAMVDTVAHKVTVYFPDAEEATRNMPSGLLTNIGSLVKIQHPRIMAFFLINPNPSTMTQVWSQLVKTALPKSKQRFFIVPSMEAARQEAAEMAEFQRTQAQATNQNI